MKIFYPFYQFYIIFRDGFKSMTLGKTLWIIVVVKLFIMFAILRVFLFPNYLNSNFDDNKSKSDHVRQELIRKSE